ncbi:DUF3422 family protein [Hoeflea prorocentri]|uniref:DUF3422 family protein n=1 Tax=Hoeflea prorocentri TaxID=1922333 RepID=A0A9X3UKH9_9HYPH|nr:DUF3422 family protein [Hoeflea prorocentri]MCY6382329.1 DUF3422 family protein [Hoeflea prorocentri]MDA5400129.1 DUF3422 family protein [Hoeflea prorocentri]
MANGSFGFPIARDRPLALGEVHARPYPLIKSPRIILQLAFMTDGGASVDNAVLAALARTRGVAAPQADARHYVLSWGTGSLRWERHTEFSTYFYEGPVPTQFGGEVTDHPFGDGFSPPGSLISGVRLEVRKWTDDTQKVLKSFDPASLCFSEVENGAAAAVTDFRQDKDGLTRILLLDRDLAPARVGALAQRLIEIETYRTLAMLALPLANSLSPQMRRIEDGLTMVTQRMRKEVETESDSMLGEITALAAELEAGAASSLYRFGASRAYDGIVAERIATLNENPIAGYETWGAFLQRRMAPAMRTCRSIEERQANLSRKLARATALLRSWVDLQLERQNSELLQSMNRRAKLQLRLQQTVEGLSVAAVSYYVVGLFGYLAKAANEAGLPISPTLATGLSVPVIVLAIWGVVRRIRKRHGDKDEA